MTFHGAGFTGVFIWEQMTCIMVSLALACVMKRGVRREPTPTPNPLIPHAEVCYVQQTLSAPSAETFSAANVIIRLTRLIKLPSTQ